MGEVDLDGDDTLTVSVDRPDLGVELDVAGFSVDSGRALVTVFDGEGTATVTAAVDLVPGDRR